MHSMDDAEITVVNSVIDATIDMAALYLHCGSRYLMDSVCSKDIVSFRKQQLKDLKEKDLAVADVFNGKIKPQEPWVEKDMLSFLLILEGYYGLFDSFERVDTAKMGESVCYGEYECKLN